MIRPVLPLCALFALTFALRAQAPAVQAPTGQTPVGQGPGGGRQGGQPPAPTAPSPDARPVALDAPSVQISNKQLKLKIFVPDAQKGFYRATRFDWSGAIGDMEFAGHHVYHPWFQTVDPAVRDFAYFGDGIGVGPNTGMSGPVEEFQKAIGYDTAKVGDTFLKIGVGILRKGDDQPYTFGKHFDIVDGGKWTTKSTGNSVTFEQVLGTPQSDYAYVYTKTIRLVGDESKMVIEHHLKNVGKQPLETRLYDHNFLDIDSLNIGTGVSVTVPYDLKPTRPANAAVVKIDGKTASYVADLKGQDRAQFGLQGFGTEAKDYDFLIENKTAGMSVHMQGDQPLVDASVWSIRPVMAVEPFINISAAPAATMSWTYTYTYSKLQ